MPVTFLVNDHPALSVQFPPKESPHAFTASIVQKMYPRLTPRLAENHTHLLSSSLRQGPALAQLVPVKHGFVDACIAAYNEHQHLVVRPDDVWMAIISQFSFFANNHPDRGEFKEKLIPLDKRKKLKFSTDSNNWTTNYGWLTQVFLKQMNDNVPDKELASWILPKFSTTTKVDALCTSIMMMGTLKANYSYQSMALCGIPTVTLEGVRADYEELLRRVDKLQEFGEETYFWGEMLKPILTRFITAFDGDPDLLFWNHICHRTNEMCGDEYFTGWITAFCPFDQQGRWQLFTPAVREHMHIDGVRYQALPMDKIPWGYSQVDFRVIQSGVSKEASFCAGLMGLKVTKGPTSKPNTALGLVYDAENTTVAPHPSWFIIEKIGDIPLPPETPEPLQDLRLFLRRADYEAGISTGVPLLHTRSPITVPRLLGSLESSEFGSVSSRKSPTEVSFGSDEKSSSHSRKLRKDRPPLPFTPKDNGIWGFHRRKPLTTFANARV